MAKLHDTTLVPSKLELLELWLPHQPWYRGAGQVRLSKVGGFRLDDPAGEVGIEFMFVRDDADDAVTYNVPMGYRGAPLEGASSALVGNMEHGVLGTRWVYDGEHDPVVVAQLLALARGEVQAQAQGRSDTVDTSVTVHPVSPHAASVEIVRVLREQDGGVQANWQRPDGSSGRGRVATIRGKAG